MDKENKLNIVLSFFIILAAAVIYRIIIPQEISVPVQLRGKYLSPAFAPRVFTLYLGLMGCVLLGFSIAGLKNRKSDPQTGHDDAAKPWKARGFIVTLWLFCCLFAWAVKYVGILIPSMLFLGILMKAFGQKKWMPVLSTMLLVPVLLYLFFHGIAKVPLPKGILFG